MLHAIVAWFVRPVFRVAGYAMLAFGAGAIMTRHAIAGTRFASDFAVLDGFVLKVGVTFLIAGLTLACLSHFKGPLLPNEMPTNPAPTESAGGGWLNLLVLCLIALPFVALAQLGPLRALWEPTVDLANRCNLKEELGSHPESSGLIVLPIMAALLVPLAELVLAASFLLSSVCLLMLFAFRSRLFPRVFLMSIVLQCALLLGARYAIDVDIVGRVRQAIERQSPDARHVDVDLLLDWAKRHEATVGPVARGLSWTFTGYAIWLPVLFLSARVRIVFTRDPVTATSLA